MPQTYRIQSGDTLSELARRYNVSVADIVRANGITNPDRIYEGDELTIPDQFTNGTTRSGPDANDEWWRTPTPMLETFEPERRSDAPAGPVRASNGREFPTSHDGTPLYRQGDEEWGGRMLGSNRRVSSHGCAMTATAMAISKISGQPITPGELDQFLDRHRGYSGDNIRWDEAAAARGLGVANQPFSINAVNEQIDAGRPVVIGVDYKNGAGTDHWITVTRRERDAQGVSTYYANDPATGQEIRFREQGGRLVQQGGRGYESSGRLISFTGGRTQVPRTESTNSNPAYNPTAGGQTLRQQLSNPDTTLSVAIGNAEGTRTRTGGRTSAYGAHNDPGNGRRNLGTFSYQAYQNPNVRTPEQADAVQLQRLRAQIPAYESAVRRAGLDPNNPRLQAAYFDLWNQSPRMAQRFLERLPQTLAGREITVESLTAARLNSCYDDRGRFTSTGLNNPRQAERDQRRRLEAIGGVLRERRAV